MASALSGKLSLSKFLSIQAAQNKLQKAGLSTNTLLSKVALLLKAACSMHADTHTHRASRSFSISKKAAAPSNICP